VSTFRRAQLDVGEELAGYRVEAFIARGGMAVVYRARDLTLSRPVALKLIAPELSSNENFRARFVRESELAASIDHPNIIPVYGAGEADGLLYIAMRFVDGEDLGALLRRRGRLPVSEAMPLFTALAGALDAAHARDLVHRDIKPGNVLLTTQDEAVEDRHVYLTDFGLTKRSSSLTGFTATGHFLGTIAYVAPEQIENRGVDRRTDVYSLACLFFEVLAGSLPFQHDDDAGLLWAHVTQAPPPLSTRIGGVPAEVDHVLARAMAKNPAERQPSCRQLVAELRSAFRAPVQPYNDHRTSLPPTRVPTAPPSRPPTHLESRPPTPPPTQRESRPGGPWVPVAGSGPSTGRPRTSRRLAVVAAAAALVVAVALWLVLAPPWSTWVRYDGSDATAPFALEHPAEWLQHPDRQGVMFAAQHLVGVFTTGDLGKWDQATRSADTPERVEGVLVRRTPEQVSLAGPDDAEATVAAIPAFTRAQPPSAVHATVHGAQAWRLDGRLADPRSPGGLQIAYEYYLVPIPGGTAHVVFFALPDRVASAQATFDRIRDSVELPTT
jgi:serine/threonine protein kinase